MATTPTIPYATPAEVDDYMTGRLSAEAWTTAIPDDKTAAVIMATRAIDILNFLGEKSVESQELQFPRDEDSAVPQDIKNACAEEALALLDGKDPDLEFENLGMKSQGYANVRSTYDTNRPTEHILAGITSSMAWRFIKPYLRDPLSVDFNRVS